MKFSSILLFLCLALLSCSGGNQSFEISEFTVLENFDFETDTLEMEMDLSGGPFAPIFIPSQNNPDGEDDFEFSFKIGNQTNTDQNYSYKIYYHNISYGHSITDPSGEYNPKSAENFYGSWISDTLISFKDIFVETRSEKYVTDQFRIAGNPLNDPRYFNPDPSENYVSPGQVERMMQTIQRDPNWMKIIKEKSEKNNESIEDQLFNDALWTVRNNGNSNNENRRWQNNPRVGLYEFLLVVGTKQSIEELPVFIHDPLSLDSEYGVRMNPLFFFQDERKPKSQIKSVKAKEHFRTFAVLRPSYGLYFDPASFRQPSEAEYCSDSEITHKKAHFIQYLNTEVRDSSLNNINYKYDVVGKNLSRENFQEISSSLKRNPNSYTENGKKPCVNARYDEAENAIIVENPGNLKMPYRKENAGVEGRIGFTYGKFIGRIKFPEVLSDDNVWNGITCAYWLKFQSLSEWNTRDTCFGSGYLKSGYSSEEAVYTPTNSYSEIDIEIVKASRYWPTTSEKSRVIDGNYDPAEDHNLIVTCTNWDLACQEPANFHAGSKSILSNQYYTHRWTNWYKALTIKTEKQHDHTVGDQFEYEIEWKPTEIIWRIGPDQDSMSEVGYMDSSITKIPSNQMVPVMSQEFHYGHWWPTTPFHQGDIPYPESPITGYLYEVEIR